LKLEPGCRLIPSVTVFGVFFILKKSTHAFFEMQEFGINNFIKNNSISNKLDLLPDSNNLRTKEYFIILLRVFWSLIYMFLFSA
jgi:hypothetical protein